MTNKYLAWLSPCGECFQKGANCHIEQNGLCGLYDKYR